MKKILKTSGIFVILLALVLAGCKSIPRGPKHDEVLIYNKPYDYTYLKVLESINRTPGWSLYDTDKEAGLISAWSDTYEDLFDADTRRATFLVRRLERRKTSVELVADSQDIAGVGELMKQINITLGKYKEDKGVVSQPYS